MPELVSTLLTGMRMDNTCLRFDTPRSVSIALTLVALAACDGSPPSTGDAGPAREAGADTAIPFDVSSSDDAWAVGDAPGDAPMDASVDAPVSVCPGPSCPSLAALLPLLVRGGHGPFSLTLARDGGDAYPERIVVPQSASRCDAPTIVDEPGHAAVILHHCGIDHAALPAGTRALSATELGDGFDFEVHLRTQADLSIRLEPVVRNRLGLGIALVRVVLRFPAAIVPASDEAHLAFGLDDWVRNPVARLVPAARGEHGWYYDYYRAEAGSIGADGAGMGFYPDFHNTRPLVSIHAPAFAAMFHFDDPRNIGVGTMMVGSNDGALELGLEWHVADELSPGNGTTSPLDVVTPARIEVLPNATPSEEGHWETSARYRAWGERSGTFTTTPITERDVPADWARECIYSVHNLGAAVDGTVPDEGGVPNLRPATVDGVAFAASFEDIIAMYEPVGAQHFCPMLWGWSGIGPYQAIGGLSDLVSRLDALATERGVEIHPWVYMHPSMLGRGAFGTPLEAAIVHDLRGDRLSYEPPGDQQLFIADPSHAGFRSHILETVRGLAAAGLEGVYFDNPFFNHAVTREHGGVDPTMALAVATLIDEAVAVLEETGGVVWCERQRAGLPSAYASGQGWLPGSSPAPMTHALVHDLQIVSGFGDFALASLPTLAADADLIPGPHNVAGASEAIYAMFGTRGAALGEVPIHLNGVEDWIGSPSLGPIEQAMARLYETTVLSGVRARLLHDELRTGRLLRTPDYDSPEDQLLRRGTARSPVDFTDEVFAHPYRRITVGFFESLERPGNHAISIGNPAPSPATVEVALPRDRYPSLPASAVLEGPGEALTPLTAAQSVWRVRVTVPARSVAVVQLRP